MHTRSFIAGAFTGKSLELGLCSWIIVGLMWIFFAFNTIWTYVASWRGRN